MWIAARPDTSSGFPPQALPQQTLHPHLRHLQLEQLQLQQVLQLLQPLLVPLPLQVLALFVDRAISLQLRGRVPRPPPTTSAQFLYCPVLQLGREGFASTCRSHPPELRSYRASPPPQCDLLAPHGAMESEDYNLQY